MIHVYLYYVKKTHEINVNLRYLLMLELVVCCVHLEVFILHSFSHTVISDILLSTYMKRYRYNINKRKQLYFSFSVKLVLDSCPLCSALVISHMVDSGFTVGIMLNAVE